MATEIETDSGCERVRKRWSKFWDFDFGIWDLGFWIGFLGRGG